jgi:hypothetical protein
MNRPHSALTPKADIAWAWLRVQATGTVVKSQSSRRLLIQDLNLRRFLEAYASVVSCPIWVSS